MVVITGDEFTKLDGEAIGVGVICIDIVGVGVDCGLGVGVRVGRWHECSLQRSLT